MSELLHFGLPTVPAEASVYALSIVDRYYIYHDRSPTLAGLYSIAVKLAGAVAFIVRAFQYAWPPLAYSVTDDAEASRLYGLVTTYYVFVAGWVVAGLTLLGRWVLRILTAPSFFDAYKALPWVSLGWALYGLWVVFLVIAGRAKVTTRNFPAALAGLVANVLLILVLVPSWGSRARGSRCAAPTWSCWPSCTCSRAVRSGCSLSGRGWRDWFWLWAALRPPVIWFCRPTASSGC